MRILVVTCRILLRLWVGRVKFSVLTIIADLLSLFL